MEKIIFNRCFRKHSKTKQREKRFVNYDKAKDILIIFQSNKNNDAVITEIINTLKKDKKNVDAWGYLPARTEIRNNSSEIKLFNKKSINIFQKPSKDIINKIKPVKYDLLIDLSLHSSIPLMYLTLYADAAMKTGSKVRNPSLYDFIIEINHTNIQPEESLDEKILFDKIIFYLKSIQITD